MDYFFHTAAQEELIAAAEYLCDRDASLPSRFFNAIEQCIQRIVDSPSTLPIYGQEVRYCSTRGFSYVLLFRVNGAQIEIVSVKHTSRDEGFWKSRLEDDSDKPQE